MDNLNRLAKHLLEAELNVIAERLQTEAIVPSASLAGGDYLDLAQSLEHRDGQDGERRGETPFRHRILL
jgi:hypothetical protein